MTSWLWLRRTISIAVLLLVATRALANIPPGLTNFQGVLRDTSNLPLNGNYSIVFRYWSDATSVVAATHEIGWETHPLVAVNDGLFTALLGSQPFSNGASGYGGLNIIQMFGDFESVYLQLEVDGDVLLPRIRFAAAPYAFNCTQLQDKAPGEFLRSEGSENFTGSDLYGYTMTFDPATTLNVAGALQLAGSAVASSADELNRLDGVAASVTAANLSTLTSGGIADALHQHTNVNASTVDGLDGTQFLRSDASDSFTTGTLSMALGTTLSVNGDLSIGVGSSFPRIFFSTGELPRPDFGLATHGAGFADDRFEFSKNVNVTGLLHAGPLAHQAGQRAYHFLGDYLVAGSTAGYITDNTDLYVTGDIAANGRIYANSQLHVASGNSVARSYSAFGSSAPVSGDITTGDDLLVSSDIEVGGAIYATSSATPSSGTIGGSGDLYVENQFELDGTAYLNGSLVMDDNGPDGDQSISFYEAGASGTESLKWADINNRFEVSDDLLLTGVLHTGAPTEAPVSYNRIASSTGTPDSGDVTGRGDLYVEFDLEVDSQLFVNGEIRLDDDGPDHNQILFFYDDGLATNESLAWSDAEDRFEASNDLAVGGTLRVGSTAAPPVAYSVVGAGTASLADDFNDLFVGGTVEVGGTLAANGLFYLDFDGLDANQSICFYEASACGRELTWDNAQNRFEMNDSLKLTGAIELNNTIEMDDDGPEQNQRIYFWEDGILNGESFGWTDASDRFEITDSLHVTGDLSATGAKPFVQNHPVHGDLSVVYAALEGDEVGTYTRGSARLENGVARVVLGETFALVTNPEVGLTAHVTPRAPGAQLYVESISTKELIVASDPGSTPDAAFDYVVQGLRIGFEAWDVVRPRSIDAPVPSLVAMEQRYVSRPELRAHAPDQRFLRMQPRFGQPIATTTGAAAALRSAIGEYDPEAEQPVELTSNAGTSGAETTDDLRPRTQTSPAHKPTSQAPTSSETSQLASSAQGPWFRHYVVLEAVEAGDVLVSDPTQPDRLRRAASIADPGVVGVAIGEPGTQYPASTLVPVAESGIALCRVDAAAGMILRGDLLVAGALPGSAVRQAAPNPGTILGKALEPHQHGVGWIRVLIAPR